MFVPVVSVESPRTIPESSRDVNPIVFEDPMSPYFSYQRVPKDSTPEKYAEVAPELVFEVKSPSDRWKEITDKAGEYLTAGTIVVCVLDPETRTVGIYTADAFPSRK